jgi:hypothetical protein
LQHLPQCGPIVGEILLHAHGAAAEGHDRQQIRRLHLRVHEGLRRRVGTHLIGGRHRGQVEVEHQQPTVAVPRVAGRWNRNLSLRRRRCAGAGGEPRRRRSCAHVGRPVGQALELDEADRLLLTVFGHDEIAWRQSFDGTAVFVADAYCLDDKPRGASKRFARAAERALARLRSGAQSPPR